MAVPIAIGRICGALDGHCLEAAVMQLQVGCIHEHVYSTLACAFHGDSSLRPGARVSCYLCLHGPEPHHCPQTLSVVADRRPGRPS